jgi:hypothetical protein
LDGCLHWFNAAAIAIAIILIAATGTAARLLGASALRSICHRIKVLTKHCCLKLDSIDQLR